MYPVTIDMYEWVVLHSYRPDILPFDMTRRLDQENIYALPDAPPDIKGFMTGSRVYGTPRPDSDYDMVVYVTMAYERELKQKSDSTTKILFGNLNLITCTRKEQFNAWYEGTRRLEALKPVTRAFAVEVFESLGLRRAPDLVTYNKMAVPNPCGEVTLEEGAGTKPGAKWYISAQAKAPVLTYDTQLLDQKLLEELMKSDTYVYKKYPNYFDQESAWQKEYKMYFDKQQSHKLKTVLKGGK